MRKTSIILAIILVVILVVVLIVVFWHATKQKKVPEEIQEKIQEKNLSSTSIEQTDGRNHVKKRSEKSSKTRNRVPQKGINNKNQIKTIYNEDPVIDVLLVYSKYKYCFDVMAPATNSRLLYLSNYFNTSSQEKKKQRLKEYQEVCKKIVKQHPQLSFDKGFNFSEMDNKTPTSALGKKLTSETYDISDNYELNEKVADIKRAGADLLLSGNYLFYMDFDKIFKLDLYDLLQSNNYDYVMTIYNYAQDLYACRHGADCGKYSTVVLTKCISNDAFCVDDFEILVKTQLTVGQQADIDIAYNYLLQMFD